MRKVKSQFRLAACAVISFLTALSPLQQLTVGVNAEGESDTGAPADTTPVLYSYNPVSIPSDSDLNFLNGQNFVIALTQKNDRTSNVTYGYTSDEVDQQTDYALTGQMKAINNATKNYKNYLQAYKFVTINAKFTGENERQNIAEFDDQAMGGQSVWKFEKIYTDQNAYHVELLNSDLMSYSPKKYLKIGNRTTDSGITDGGLSVVEEDASGSKPTVYIKTSSTYPGKISISKTTNDNDLSVTKTSENGEDQFHAYNPTGTPGNKWLTLYQINNKIAIPDLTTIQTLDSKSTGITTTMYDYYGKLTGAADGKWGSQDGTEQSQYIGIGNQGSDNYTNEFKQGIVENNLSSSGGLPVVNEKFRGTANQSDGSLEGLFGASKGEKSNNLLFSSDIYNSTGWFQYNSRDNYAYFDRNTGNFSVYNQIGTPIYKSAFADGENHPGPYECGNFMPYNNISKGKYSNYTNIKDIEQKTLSDTDQRKYEVLYKTQNTNVVTDPSTNATVEGNDYYFGMQMDVPSFYQPKDGKAYKKENGIEQNATEDMQYEFSGDDDLWIFVDNVLVLDIGGNHGAISGNINFATGTVTVGPGGFETQAAKPAPTTIKDCFEKAFQASGYSEQQIKDKIDKLFKPTSSGGYIFKDYTIHSLKMFYMERGAGASNLNMRFNLQLPTKFTVKNTMVNNPDYSTYEKKDYKFQAMKKNPDRTSTPITSEYTKAVYVDDNGHETPVTFDKDGTFSLKLNQKVKFVLPDISDEYYVQEVGVDPDLIRRVRLKVNNDPDTELAGNNGTFSGTSRKVANAETGDDLVFINEPVYRLKVVKEDGNDSAKKLAGAVFNLGTQNGRVISGNLKTSDDKGVATENKDRNSDAMRLTDGTYTLNETTAPEGYALMQGNLNLVIQDASEKENAVKVSSDGSVPYGSLSYEKDSDDFTVYTITVKNYQNGVTPDKPLPPGNSSDQSDQKSLQQVKKTSVSGKGTVKQQKNNPESKAVPDTADHTGIVRWTGLLIGAIAVIGCVLGFRKKYSN